MLAVGCAFCLLPAPYCSAPLALGLGIAVGLWGGASSEKWPKVVSKYLIQACVVMLGFRIDLHDLVRAASSGWMIAIGSIIVTLGLGLLLGKLFKVERETSTLVTCGTAICGGSAIAAVGSAMNARPGSIAVATGAIFVLNAIGLFVIPTIGQQLGLTAEQFGTWAGVALHDVASVGGAAKAFAPDGSAIDTANIVKLTRVIWIFPLALGFGMLAARERRKENPGAQVKVSSPFPWFIVWFLAASLLRTLIPAVGEYAGGIRTVASSGFQVALFLIGTGLTRKTLREVGWRAVAHAAVLWMLVASGTLGVILWSR